MKTLLELFEESGKEVYEVTRSEWIEIHKDHTLNWIKEINKTLSKDEQIKDIGNRLHTDSIEAGCFHQAQVERALKDGIEVSEIVLKDYKGMKDKIKAEQNRQEEIRKSKIELTYDMVKDIKKNTKIMINNIKYTLIEKDTNCIVCKPYRSKNKAYQLPLGQLINKFSIGWN
jgi:hypothetical protein